MTLEERLERKSCQAGKEQTSILGRGNGTCQECKCSSPLCSGESEEFARLKPRKWVGYGREEVGVKSRKANGIHLVVNGLV